METINLVLASDANYFPGLLVTAVSLARHASRDVALVFNILDGGLGEENLAFLQQKLEASHPAVDLKVFAVDAAQFAAFPEWNSGSRMTYARLLAAELISDADFVLYCDVDFLWTADVADLWALRDERCAVQACADEWPRTLAREKTWYAARGIDVDMSHYICAGMLLINLKRFRADGLTRKLMDFLNAHPDVQFVDQSAINGVVKEIGLLPRAWGRFARNLHAQELPGRLAIHYAGSAPWKDGWWSQAITDAHLLWYRLYADLYGLSYRAVVARCLTKRQYWTRRFTWIVVQHAALRLPFFLFLRLCGRGCYITELSEMIGG